MATKIILDCGIEAEHWTYKDTEHLRISLSDLYEGSGTLNDFNKLAELFTELSAKGYCGRGVSIDKGWYDSTTDILLDVSRKIIL